MDYWSRMPQVPQAPSYNLPQVPKDFPHDAVDKNLISSAVLFFEKARGDDMMKLTDYYQKSKMEMEKKNIVFDQDGLRKIAVSMFLRSKAATGRGRTYRNKRKKTIKNK
jgi:hypothetical protein